MVVLAAGVCTKSGKALVSRQFVEMQRSRIEGLLASFPKLIGSGDQHTYLETESVRYVYQPMEELYMILVTNKTSNILQDIDTLHLFARALSEYCRSVDEKEILNRAFELISVFDEIISLGYRENVSLAQIRTITEMESHEEKIAAEIQRNKEKEAREELNRKARMMEIQKKQMGKSGGYGGNMGGFGGGSGFGPDRSRPSPTSYSDSAPQSSYESEKSPFGMSSSKGPAAPAPGRGMQLGKKPRASELMEAIKTEEGLDDARDSVAKPGRGPAAAAVHTESVHIAIEERISALIKRDGGVNSVEVKGDMMLRVSDPSKARIKVAVAGATDDESVQFKTHPNVDKGLFTSDNVLALKDSGKPFPLNQSLGILRWRQTSKESGAIPLSINCWPSPSGEGTCDVNIEYELENKRLELKDVVISIPYPSGGGAPTVGEVDGLYEIDKQHRVIEWQLPIVDSSNRSGSLEFTVNSDNVNAFFPIKVTFSSSKSLFDIDINEVSSVDDDTPVQFSKEVSLMTEEYQIV
ncbi:hypothetical protein DFJ74DRAFT_663805 [Hyaloraphidium curvatum]|nr:hypothetical protein DFJ74DRAFT_663805 [Hyaloraphidium curvatum]